MKEIIKPTTEFYNVYMVQNFGTFRGLFYSFKDAKQFVREAGTYDGKEIYQIYKGKITFNVQLYK